MWKSIEDYDGDFAKLSSQELRGLESVWFEQKEAIEARGVFQEFLKRLQRRWAIETGIIERVYSLDRGITEVLIEQGINSSLIPTNSTDRNPELVAQIIIDHTRAIEAIFDFVKGTRTLSTSYIKELHSLFTQHQDTTTARDSLGKLIEVKLIRGDYKILPNNPTRPDGTVYEYCPPEHVASEMDRLIELHLEHLEKNVPPEVESAWLHHRFSQIHPFQDGNGRVARALASLIFLRAGWLPLTITRDMREKYISALERADEGDLSDLVNVFATNLKKTFVKALTLAEQVRFREGVDQVIESAKDIFVKKKEDLYRQWEAAKEIATQLHDDAYVRFHELRQRLEADIGGFSDDFYFTVAQEHNGGERPHWFRRQIIYSAKSMDYFANTRAYHSWIRLTLGTKPQAEILLSFHGLGQEYGGIIAATLCFFHREETEDGFRDATDVVCVPEDIFQINYKDDRTEARDRFATWLEQSLIKAMEMWRKDL